MEQHVNTLLSVYGEDLNRLRNRVGKDRSENTFRAMNMGRDYVERFLKERYGLDDIPIERLTPQFIQDFSIYLSADKGLRGGTVWLACQQLKGVVTRAYWRGDITWNPFAGFHIAKNIRPREYLTEEELERLITHHFDKPQLSYARDVFVFAAFTGLSYIDLKELRVSDIKDINGATWIVSQRHKTKVAYQVKLLDIPLRILHHYLKPGEERVFANMEYRMMAKRILTIMQEIGVTKHITMHCARHSFAVNILNNGANIKTVASLLGHSSLRHTEKYTRAIDKLKEDAINSLPELKL